MTAQQNISQRASALRSSLIREIAEQGIGNQNIIPLWFGEGCWPTSDIAVKAAAEALGSDDHFYHPNSGKTTLRQQIVSYQNRLYQRQLSIQNITVTASGMQALALASQAIINPGDKVVVIDPVWPNLPEIFKIAGAEIQTISLEPRAGRWHLDLDKLLSALTPQHRAVMINSPNNPTGWVMSEDEIQAVLAHCRKHNIWIITDEVYARLCRGADIAPSFQHFADAEDNILSVNSFSKAWSMTGWRLGWIVAPAALESTFAQLTEFNIACPAGFIQSAGEAMLRDGEKEVALLQRRVAQGYEILTDGLRQIDRVSFIEPQGAFYLLFAIDGYDDSLALAQKLLQEAEVGLAPGAAFGSASQGYLRCCYAQETDRLEEAVERIKSVL